jgi:hypothetical protein
MAIGGEVRDNNAAIDGSDTNASLIETLYERGRGKGKREKEA